MIKVGRYLFSLNKVINNKETSRSETLDHAAGQGQEAVGWKGGGGYVSPKMVTEKMGCRRLPVLPWGAGGLASSGKLQCCAEAAGAAKTEDAGAGLPLRRGTWKPQKQKISWV